MIIAQLSAIPERQLVLNRVIESLYHQVDLINLNLSVCPKEGSAWCPAEFLTNAKINVQFHTNKIQDGSKFINAPESPGHYVLVCDDDIEYSHDFAERMIYAHRMAGGIVSVMGKNLKPRPIKSYFKDEIECFKTFESVTTMPQVEIPGTCGMIYHTSEIMITIDDMVSPNSDICVAALAKRKAIKCHVRPHESDWLTNLMPEVGGPSMFDKYKDSDSLLTKFINQNL